MGSGSSTVPAGYQVINPRPPAAGPSATQRFSSVVGGVTSLLGGAAKFAGGYLSAQNQFTAAKAEATLMRSEADIMDYNADLARWEGIIAEQERDIEIDEHRDSVALGPAALGRGLIT